MSNLNEAQINLIRKMGSDRVTATDLSFSEGETLGGLITLGIVEKVRGKGGWSAWRVVNFYDLMEELDTASTISEPAADEIELPAPTDATLGDEIHDRPFEEPISLIMDTYYQPETRNTETYKTVTIPARDEHEGYHARIVTLKWVCPVCGSKRGEPFDALSYDGSMRLNVHSWMNPCGHVDKYADVCKEADAMIAPEILPEVAPLPAANMYTNTIAAKDEHISQLEARVKELEAQVRRLKKTLDLESGYAEFLENK